MKPAGNGDHVLPMALVVLFAAGAGALFAQFLPLPLAIFRTVLMLMVPASVGAVFAFLIVGSIPGGWSRESSREWLRLASWIAAILQAAITIILWTLPWGAA